MMKLFVFTPLRTLVVLMLAFFPLPGYSDPVSEYDIKAAFIYNFARFTEWPKQNNILKICIYGKDPFRDKIDKLDGKQVNNKTIKIIRTHSLVEIKTCHITFLNIIPPERQLFERVLREIKGAHVLTISDAADVIEFGVMIGLTVDAEDKVRFNINLANVDDEKIKISSQILNLASEVKY